MEPQTDMETDLARLGDADGPKLARLTGEGEGRRE